MSGDISIVFAVSLEYFPPSSVCSQVFCRCSLKYFVGSVLAPPDIGGGKYQFIITDYVLSLGRIEGSVYVMWMH